MITPAAVRPVTGTGTINPEAVDALQELRDTIALYQDEIKGLKRIAEPLEAGLIEALDAGHLPAPGCKQVAVKESSAIRPHWRDIFEAWNGKEATDLVISETPPTVTRSLVIGK